jgi:hypothetical protein
VKTRRELARRASFVLLALSTACSTSAPAAVCDFVGHPRCVDGGSTSSDSGIASNEGGSDVVTPGFCATLTDPPATLSQDCTGGDRLSTCAGCALPFHYECTGGSPANVTGCKLSATDSFNGITGYSFCCPTNPCVHASRLDVVYCRGATPRAFVCDLSVPIPSGCVQHNPDAGDDGFRCCP